MEQSGLKDERVAHIAGSERPGERPRPRLLGPRTRWLRMSGQSSFSCDRKEDPPVKKLNSQTSFPPLPPAPPIFQKMRDGACDPSPGFFYKISDSFLSLVARPSLLDLSLLVGGPLAGIPVGGAGRRLVGVVGALRPPVLLAHLPPPARNRRWRRGWGGGCRQMFSPPASPARRCEFLRCRRSVGLWSEAGRVVLIRGSGKRSGPVRACAVIE